VFMAARFRITCIQQELPASCKKEELNTLKSKTDIQLLHCACIAGDINTANFCISQQAENLTPEELNESLCLACENGHDQIVSLLFDKFPTLIDPTVKNYFCLEISCHKNYLKIISLLFSKGKVSPRVLDHFPVRFACKSGNIELLNLLLEHPETDLTCFNNFCVGLASQYGHLEIVKILMKFPVVDPSSNNNYALKIAKEHGFSHIVEILQSDERVLKYENISKSQIPVSEFMSTTQYKPELHIFQMKLSKN